MNLQIDLLTEGTVNEQPLRLHGTGEGNPETGRLSMQLTADGPWPDGGFDPRILANYCGHPTQISVAAGDGMPSFAEVTGGAYHVDPVRQTLIYTPAPERALVGKLEVTGTVTRRGDRVVVRQDIDGFMRLPAPLAEVRSGVSYLWPVGPGQAAATIRDKVVVVGGEELELRSDIPYQWDNQGELPAPVEYVIEPQQLEWSGLVVTRRAQATLRPIGAKVLTPA